MTWRTTKHDRDLDYRCDLCGKAADTIHFLPGVTGCEEVLFACRDHDPGGYWVAIKEWFDGEERWVEHVMAKGGGWRSLGLLAARIDALRRL